MKATILYLWEQRGRYESGLWMYRSNFTTGEHDVKRRKLRLWTVYEQATACPGRFSSIGHMKLNSSMTREHDNHMLQWKFVNLVNHFPARYHDLLCR